MKKESKANLIFVSLLVCSMIPGIFMLVRKKLNGDMTSAALPDPVPFAVAYNQPPPFPPSLPRREPPLVRDWVARLTQEKVGIDVSLLRSATGGPVVSDGFATQALAVLPEQDNFVALWLLIWRDLPTPTNADPKVSTIGDASEAGDLIAAAAIDIPKDVRHALQAVGYIDPPPRAWLVGWKFPTKDHVINSKTIQISRSGSKASTEILTLP